MRVIGRGGFGVVKMVRAKKTGVRPRAACVLLVYHRLLERLLELFHERYALKCVRKRDVVEKNVQDALVSELSILKEARAVEGHGRLLSSSLQQWLLQLTREVDHPFIIKFVRSFRNEHASQSLMVRPVVSCKRASSLTATPKDACLLFDGAG